MTSFGYPRDHKRDPAKNKVAWLAVSYFRRRFRIFPIYQICMFVGIWGFKTPWMVEKKFGSLTTNMAFVWAKSSILDPIQSLLKSMVLKGRFVEYSSVHKAKQSVISKSSRWRIFLHSSVRSWRLLTIEYSRQRRITQEISKTTVSFKFVKPLGKYKLSLILFEFDRIIARSTKCI